ncbi:MAG: heme-binding domain-containing protein [Bdellovibrionota bacterium]
MIFILLVWSGAVFGHEGHHHAPHPPADSGRQAAYARINEDYIRTTKAIFEQKCNNCHSAKTDYPAYYRYPIISWFIDRDIREARSHIDMTNGFPFRSHATPEEDLKSIREEVSEGDMPTFAYRVMHPEARWTEGQKKIVLDWCDRSLEELKKNP